MVEISAHRVSNGMELQCSQAPAIDPDLIVTEGTVPFTVGQETFQTWYRLCGSLEGATEPPLVVLHGGPGTFTVSF